MGSTAFLVTFAPCPFFVPAVPPNESTPWFQGCFDHTHVHHLIQQSTDVGGLMRTRQITAHNSTWPAPTLQPLGVAAIHQVGLGPRQKTPCGSCRSCCTPACPNSAADLLALSSALLTTSTSHEDQALLFVKAGETVTFMLCHLLLVPCRCVRITAAGSACALCCSQCGHDQHQHA